jgi:hypothetical protein
MSIQQINDWDSLGSSTRWPLSARRIVSKFLGDCEKEGSDEVTCNVDGVALRASKYLRGVTHCLFESLS